VIGFGSSHLKTETLEESILKNFTMKKPNLNERDSKEGTNNNNNNKSVQNRDGADRGSTTNNRYQQQKKFQPRRYDQHDRSGYQQQQNRFQSRQFDQQDRNGFQQDKFQKNRANKSA
jgi:hypothetical protein